MKHSKLFVIAFFMLSMVFVGYQCGSTEITSAKLYMQQKNWDKAIEVLQKEISKNPKSAEGYKLLGDIYLEQNEFGKMMENYDQSLAISKDFEKEIKDNKYTAWFSSIKKGEGYFARLTKTEDKDSIKIAKDKAVKEFNDAISILPDSVVAYQYLAYTYLRDGDTEGAIKPLQKLIDLKKELDGYKYLGEIYYVNGTNLNDQGKTEEAKVEFNKSIDILEEGLKNYPDDSVMLVTLSTAYIGAGRGTEAIDKYKKLAEAKPDDQNIRYNYGVLLLGADDFAGAETQFIKAIEIEPNYDNAIYNLGVTYLKWGAFLNKKADAEGKVNDEYKSKYQSALPYLEKAVQMKDANAQTWELLGRVYSVLDMKDDATNAFKKADEMR